MDHLAKAGEGVNSFLPVGFVKFEDDLVAGVIVIRGDAVKIQGHGRAGRIRRLEVAIYPHKSPWMY